VKNGRLIADFDRETELFCRLSPSGILKIVFQLELLSGRASSSLREPDNLRTFVSSPRRGTKGQEIYVPKSAIRRAVAVERQYSAQGAQSKEQGVGHER